MGYIKKGDNMVITNTAFTRVVETPYSDEVLSGWTAATENEYNTYISTVLPNVEKEITTMRKIKGWQNYGQSSDGTISLSNIHILESSFTNESDLSSFNGASSLMPPIFAKEAPNFLGSGKYIALHPNIDAILYAFDKANTTDIPYINMGASRFLSTLEAIEHRKNTIGESISNGLSTEISNAQSALSNNDKVINQTWAQHKSQFSISTE